jgi:hypothetical protein
LILPSSLLKKKYPDHQTFDLAILNPEHQTSNTEILTPEQKRHDHQTSDPALLNLNRDTVITRQLILLFSS